MNPPRSSLPKSIEPTNIIDLTLDDSSDDADDESGKRATNPAADGGAKIPRRGKPFPFYSTFVPLKVLYQFLQHPLSKEHL